MAKRATGKVDEDAALMPAWKVAYDSLTKIGEHSDIADTINRVNEYMDQFKKEYSAPNQTANEIRPTRGSIKISMTKIKESSKKEIDTCNEALKALDHLNKLMVLRTASEAAVPAPADKRPKRGRDSSAQPPTGPTLTHPTAASSSDVLRVLLPPKPASTLKARISSQLPLHPGRKVAFRTPSDKTGKSSITPPTGEGNGYEEGAWILAVVKRSGKDNKYMVQDVESEDGQEPPTYNTNIKSLIPLPVASEPADSPSHLSAYPEYPRGTTVLALYPDTTSFYKATVVASPNDLQVAGSRTAPNAIPAYKVRFEDDQDLERFISAEEVIDFPGY